MAFTPYTESTDIILNLGKDPEDRPDLDDDGLAHKFDQNAENIVEYINNTMIPEIEEVKFVDVTASKTFDLTDRNTVQLCNHATVPINLTIPPNSSVAFPTGTVLGAMQTGAAQVAYVAGSGVTINPSAKLKIDGQNVYTAAVKRLTDTWELVGPTKA